MLKHNLVSETNTKFTDKYNVAQTKSSCDKTQGDTVSDRGHTPLSTTRDRQEASV